MPSAKEIATARRLTTPPLPQRIREAAGVTQVEVARDAATARYNISRWERGLRRPRSDDALRWARVLRDLMDRA